MVMRIVGLRIPFTNDEEHPFMWYSNPEEILIEATPGKIWFQKKHDFNLFNTVFNIMLVGILLVFSILPPFLIGQDIVTEFLDENSDEPCWPNQDNSWIFPDGEVYCEDEYNYQQSYSNYQIADDHYRLDLDGYTYEYRWSEDEGIITFAEITEGDDYYYCWQFIRASALPDNWTAADLVYLQESNNYPSWCNDNIDNTSKNYTNSTLIPFEGELLYDLYIDDMADMISSKQYSENGKLMEKIYFIPFSDDSALLAGIMVLIFPFAGLIIAANFIQRKKVLTFDGIRNVVQLEHLRWPKIGPVSNELQLPMKCELLANTRTITHSEPGDEHSSGRSWTSVHPGIDVVFNLKGLGSKAVLFLEGKNPAEEYKDLLGKLSFVLGIENPTPEGSENPSENQEEDEEYGPEDVREIAADDNFPQIIFLKGDTPKSVSGSILYVSIWVFAVSVISLIGYTYLSPYCSLGLILSALQINGIIKISLGKSIMVKGKDGSLQFRNTKDPNRHEEKIRAKIALELENK